MIRQLRAVWGFQKTVEVLEIICGLDKIQRNLSVLTFSKGEDNNKNTVHLQLHQWRFLQIVGDFIYDF